MGQAWSGQGQQGQAWWGMAAVLQGQLHSKAFSNAFGKWWAHIWAVAHNKQHLSSEQQQQFALSAACKMGTASQNSTHLASQLGEQDVHMAKRERAAHQAAVAAQLAKLLAVQRGRGGGGACKAVGTRPAGA